MLNVRVCPSCLNKRSAGFSRVSEEIWNSCLNHLIILDTAIIDTEDGVTQAYSDSSRIILLMTNEDGFNVEDGLLQEAILSGFSRHRLEPPTAD